MGLCGINVERRQGPYVPQALSNAIYGDENLFVTRPTQCCQNTDTQEDPLSPHLGHPPILAPKYVNLGILLSINPCGEKQTLPTEDSWTLINIARC